MHTVGLKPSRNPSSNRIWMQILAILLEPNSKFREIYGLLVYTYVHVEIFKFEWKTWLVKYLHVKFIKKEKKLQDK